MITARQRPNPSLSFTNVYGQAAVAAAASPAGAAAMTVGPTINFLIETFGKREKRTAQARRLADAARWGLAKAGWQVRIHVITALLNLWAAQKRLTLTRRQLEIRDQLVGLLEQRFAVGEASSLDVMRERVAQAKITFSIRNLDQAEVAARKQATANFTGLQAQIIGAIDQAAATYQTAIRAVATGDGLLADDDRRARQIADQFRAGQVDRVTLVTAQLEVAGTAISRFDAVVRQRQAIGALEDALKQPLFDPGHWPVVPGQNVHLSNSEAHP